MCPPGILRFPMGKLRLLRFIKKIDKEMTRSGLQLHESAKRWPEVTVDRMRVVQKGPVCEMRKDYYDYLST